MSVPPEVVVLVLVEVKVLTEVEVEVVDFGCNFNCS